jgi:hypothetical protein
VLCVIVGAVALDDCERGSEDAPILPTQDPDPAHRHFVNAVLLGDVLKQRRTKLSKPKLTDGDVSPRLTLACQPPEVDHA